MSTAPAPMIATDQPVTAEIRNRYRCLAGPFRTAEDEPLLRGLERHLRETGARIGTFGTPEGATVWRLASECETLIETARRLRLHKK